MQRITISVFVRCGLVQHLQCSAPDAASNITLHVIDFDSDNGFEVDGSPCSVQTINATDMDDGEPLIIERTE